MRGERPPDCKRDRRRNPVRPRSRDRLARRRARRGAGYRRPAEPTPHAARSIPARHLGTGCAGRGARGPGHRGRPGRAGAGYRQRTDGGGDCAGTALDGATITRHRCRYGFTSGIAVPGVAPRADGRARRARRTGRRRSRAAPRSPGRASDAGEDHRGGARPARARSDRLGCGRCRRPDRRSAGRPRPADRPDDTRGARCGRALRRSAGAIGGGAPAHRDRRRTLLVDAARVDSMRLATSAR